MNGNGSFMLSTGAVGHISIIIMGETNLRSQSASSALSEHVGSAAAGNRAQETLIGQSQSITLIISPCQRGTLAMRIYANVDREKITTEEGRLELGSLDLICKVSSNIFTWLL